VAITGRNQHPGVLLLLAVNWLAFGKRTTSEIPGILFLRRPSVWKRIARFAVAAERFEHHLLGQPMVLQRPDLAVRAACIKSADSENLDHLGRRARRTHHIIRGSVERNNLSWL